MSLRSRLNRLGKALKPRGVCPECRGEGQFTFSMPERGEEFPKAGCPACGAGWHLVILAHDDERLLTQQTRVEGPGGTS